MSLRTNLFALAGACLFVSASLASEPTTLDPPTLEPGVEATTIIHLDVTAGPSGAPNGFTIEWMLRSAFDMRGGWLANPNDPAIHSATFLGSPTLNTSEGTRSFLLGPGEVASIEIGDVFDETGVLATNVAEMAVGTEYVVRVRANGQGGLPSGGNDFDGGSRYSETAYVWTKPNQGQSECIRSQGYWKTHPEAWPVSSLRLGSVIYPKSQLLEIWNTAAAGNGLLALAHQLMAAKLNLIAGALAPSSVSDDIAAADALIGNRVAPPIGNDHLPPTLTSELTDDLEEFNTEESGNNVECALSTTAKRSTWGALKSIYR
jgi:hypothetical protein